MGTLWPHSNAIAFNNAGLRALGAKAYFFEAGTTTPRTTYSDAALTTPRTHPVLADGNGRFPAIFLDYGDYRERVRTAGDTMIWDTDDIPNPAPTDPAEGVDADAILQTGDMWFAVKDGNRNGAVRANGKTIGNATSGATERANDDTEDLFTFVYLNWLDAPVSGGRGANAATDFAASKTIALPDFRGAGPLGLPTMGNSNNNFLASAPVASGSVTTPGSQIGANTHTLTTGQLPTFNPASTINAFTPTGTISPSPYTPAGTVSYTPAGTITVNNGQHDHGSPTSGTYMTFVGAGGTLAAGAGGQVAVSATTGLNTSPVTASFNGTPATPSLTGTPQTFTFTGTAGGFTGSNIGSGTAHNILSRGCTGTWYIKL